MNILGVRIDNLTKKEILEKVESFLDEEKFHQIATVNPEFVLETQKNDKFREILNSCDLNVADGFGIRCAFWRYGKRLKARMTGVRLMLEILRLAEKKNIPVFLFARADGLSTWQETKEAILRIYPKLEIFGENLALSDPNPKTEFKDSSLNSVLGFCNFGAPYQELFINSIKSDKIRLAMGVGGSFDFLTGKIQRAPVFMRRMGLEWMWRLLLQPRRWKRIWRAVVVFPVKIVLENNSTRLKPLDPDQSPVE